MATDVASVEGASASVSDETIEELRARLRGPVLTKGEPGLAGVPAAPSGDARQRAGRRGPVHGTADVVAAVNFARAEGLAVAVRGGGHSIAGLSAIDGGMLIDLAAMNGVQVDPERKLAQVQGGALWGDLDRETQAHGLVAPGGVVSDTGVAGLTLGGGYGWLRRKFGLSSDSVVEAQVVCADGEVRTASEDDERRSLLGVARRRRQLRHRHFFTFELQELGPTVAFAATMYPLEDVAEVLRRWRDYADDAPNEVTSVVVTITFPQTRRCPRRARPSGRDRRRGLCRRPDKGMEVMQPLRELGTPLFDMSGPDSVHGRADRLRPAVPPRRAEGLLEVPIPRRALRWRDRPDRRPGARASGTADNGQHLPDGGRNRRCRSGGDGLRDSGSAIHGLN